MHKQPDWVSKIALTLGSSMPSSGMELLIQSDDEKRGAEREYSSRSQDCCECVPANFYLTVLPCHVCRVLNLMIT